MSTPVVVAKKNKKKMKGGIEQKGEPQQEAAASVFEAIWNRRKFDALGKKHKKGETPREKLQEWLEGIAERMMKRIDVVGDEVQKLVNEMGAVELDLKNTFNSFRCLSSTQFVENRVYEEDETESIRAETPAKDSQHPFAPTESYEDEILPRYKDAVSTAWATFQEINHQHDPASRRLRSRNKVLRNLEYDGRLHLVPHIIGTDEFARDTHCGLAELRQKRPVVDGFEIDSDTEREGADLAAELIGTGSVSEGEWSEAESDVGDQGGGLEPAVSAALDFKAMLEAALRNPSLPYDGNSSAQDIDTYGQGVDNDYFLSNVAIHNFYSSPRTISRTVDSGDHRAGNDTSANTDASDSGDWQLTGSHIPGDVAVQSTAESVDVSSALPSQPTQDQQPLRATMEELLKKPFMLKTQNSTKEDISNSSGSTAQADFNSLANLPFIPGGLFDDDESDTVSISADVATMRDSNTEPTIPEGLFKRHPSAVAAEPTQIESRSSSSVDQGKSPSRVPSFTTLRQSSNLDVNTLFKGLESKGPTKLEIPDPSSSLGNTENISSRSNTSNGPKGQVTIQSIVPPQIRGGLFDDSDDDDEDAGDLFGLTDAGIDSQPGLRTWTSLSSKGLFDDLDNEDDTPQNLAPQPSGSTHEVRNNDDLSSLLRKVSTPGRDDGRFPQRQSSWSSNSGSSSDHIRKQISSSSPSGSAFDRNRKQSPSSSPSGNISNLSPKPSSSSSLSGSSPDSPQRQSPSYNLSGSRLDRTHLQVSDSNLSESSVDRPIKQFSPTNLFGSSVDPTQKQPSGSTLVGSVPDGTSKESSVVKSDLKEESGKEKTSEPHVSLESLLAAGIRPTARAVVDPSDDDDSWSSSGSDGDGDASSRGKPDSPKSFKGFGASTESFESTHEDETTPEIDGSKPAAQAAIEHSRSSSVESAAVVPVSEEMRRSPSSIRSHDFSSPSRPGRSFSVIQVMEVPEEQPVKSQSPILEPFRPKLPFVDRTAKIVAETTSNTDVAADAGKLIHTTLSRPMGPAKRRAPSPIKPWRSTQSLPVQSPPRQNEPLARNLSQNVLPSSELSAPVIDIGRLTTGRAFTSLFDEDDGEDDLFGTYFPQKQSSSQVGSKPQETKSPLDLPSDLRTMTRDEVKGLPSPAKTKSPVDVFQARERGEPKEVASPPKTKSPFDLFQTLGRDVAQEFTSRQKRESPLDLDLDFEAKEAPYPAKIRSPIPSKVPVASPAKKSDLKVVDGEPPSGRSASKLSSLLFGDDDDNNEDALFGPLREKSSRGTGDWLASSSFSPAKTTSARRASGNSLFDD